MTPRRNTKVDILEASLRLFARNGFEATSMRNIAAAVGIQPASLYKHYVSKQAIFDAIVEHMDQQYSRATFAIGLPEGSTKAQAFNYATAPAERMAAISESMFRYWTEDEYATLFRRMLTIEQFRSTEKGALYHKYFTSDPIAWQEDLFAAMIEAGFFAEDNPKLLALEFFAPLMLLIQTSDGITNEEERAQLIDLVRTHVVRFGARHSCTPTP